MKFIIDHQTDDAHVIAVDYAGKHLTIDVTSTPTRTEELRPQIGSATSFFADQFCEFGWDKKHVNDDQND